MKNIIICLILSITLFLNAKPYIADEYNHLIQAGERIYLYGISDLPGYSIDFDKSFFSSYSIITQGSRVYLGTLKSTLTAGIKIPIYFSTIEGFDTLYVQISSDFLNAAIKKKHLSMSDTLKGTLMFRQGSTMTGNGIDSIIINAFNAERTSYISSTVFSVDSLIPFDYSSGFFPFAFAIDSINAGSYDVNIIYFANNNSDTVYNACGFCIDYKPSYRENLSILYSNNYKFITENAQRINDIDTDIISTYYNDMSDVINKKKYISIIPDDKAFFADSLFYNLKNSNSFVFLFISDIINDSIIINGIKADSFLNYSLLDTVYSIPYYLNPDKDRRTIPVFSNDYDSLTVIIRQDNMFYCFFTPQNINLDYIRKITDIYESVNRNEILKDFYTVEIVDNNEYNKYNINIYDIYGHFMGQINLGDIGTGRIVLEINKLSRLMPDLKQGLYIYRLLRGKECQSCGTFIRSY